MNNINNINNINNYNSFAMNNKFSMNNNNMNNNLNNQSYQNEVKNIGNFIASLVKNYAIQKGWIIATKDLKKKIGNFNSLELFQVLKSGQISYNNFSIIPENGACIFSCEDMIIVLNQLIPLIFKNSQNDVNKNNYLVNNSNNNNIMINNSNNINNNVINNKFGNNLNDNQNKINNNNYGRFFQHKVRR